MPTVFDRATLVALALGAASLASARQASAPEESADRLVARVLEARQVRGVRGTARLIREDLARGTSTTTRLSIKSATREGTTTVLYQVPASATAPASAVLLTLAPGRAATGHVLDGPDSVSPLTPALLQRPLFGTDLVIGDLTDDFLAWPSHRLVGGERLLGRDCAIVESRPSHAAPVAWVRSWIARTIALPLKIEKYDAEGTLRRRLIVERVAKLDDRHWGAAVLTVVGPGARTRTKLQALRGDRNVDVPPQEFDLEAIRRSLGPRGPAKQPGERAPW